MQENNDNRLITPWGYIGYGLLFAIPLVGLICAMDDGIMTAYIHYLLVDPRYQGRGIGKQLVAKMKERYKDYLRIVVVAYDEEIGFYENSGFEKASHASPMFITSLWT